MSQLRKLLGIAAATLALTSLSAVAADKPPFPRLGGYNIGGNHDYENTTYQAKLAKLDMSILGIWPGWERSHGPIETVIHNIKAINPNSKVFLYNISMELSDEASASAYDEVKTKVESMKWWLYPNGTSGGLVLSEFGRQTNKPIHVVNTTLFTPKDSDGYSYWEWRTRFDVKTFATNAPSLDGFFEDNVFWKPRTDGDWNRDGTTDSASSAQAASWLRQGYHAKFTLLNKLMPGKPQLANIADWGRKEADLTDLAGTVNGGIMEAIIGKNYSVETFAGWSEMMNWYRKMIGATAEPKYTIFHQAGTPTDYQAMRYGLASCLMDDAYYYFSDNSKGYQDVVWFDEYNSKLGQAITPPAKTAWQKGVYRRDFENGIALVNPKGNGPVEVTLEGNFKHLSGSQAPSINNGQVTSTIKLADRDGIILLRTKPSRIPDAPELVRVD